MSARRLPVRLSPEAYDDLEDIALYSRLTWGEEQRDRYMTQLDRAIKSLGDHPALGRARDELHPGYRSLLTGQHHIFYAIVEAEVHIIRIIHRSRDLRAALAEEP